MDEEKIIEIAKRNGFYQEDDHWEEFLDFAYDLLAVEREACAKLCDSSIHDTYIVGETGAEHYARRKCAAAIRARGNHD